MKYKIERLNEAVINVLGEDTYDSLKSARMSLPTIHEMACMKAFLTKLDNEDVEVIRNCMNWLKTHGMYGVSPLDLENG